MSGRAGGKGGADRRSGCGEPPGVGAALNSLPQLPGCPQLLKAQIRGAGGVGGGGVRSLRRSIHTAAQAGPGSARGSSGAPSQWGWEGGPEGASLSDTLLSNRHALLAGLWDTTLPLPPLLGLRECGRLEPLTSFFR